MKLLRMASAGKTDSADCMVTVSPADGISLDYRGANREIFAQRTRKLVEEVLNDMSVSGAAVVIDDHGAIKITIRARLETALERAAKEGTQE
jgi:citrate lyase subunit gamma (acyl carrier protein)